MAFVYLVVRADGSFYVGSTRKTLENRIAEHNAGTLGGYTASRRPVELIWSQEFSMIADAVAAERRIKGWSRAKKKALARGDFVGLKALSERRSDRFHPSRRDPSGRSSG